MVLKLPIFNVIRIKKFDLVLPKKLHLKSYRQFCTQHITVVTVKDMFRTKIGPTKWFN